MRGEHEFLHEQGVGGPIDYFALDFDVVLLLPLGLGFFAQEAWRSTGAKSTSTAQVVRPGMAGQGWVGPVNIRARSKASAARPLSPTRS